MRNVIYCDHRYQRAFLDFFEDELVRYGYDWKAVVIEYVLKGPEPLIFGTGGCMSTPPPDIGTGRVADGWNTVGHPLIHLAVGIPLSSARVISHDPPSMPSNSTAKTSPWKVLMHHRAFNNPY